MNDMDALQIELGEWADATFGGGDRRSAVLAHLRSEIKELEAAWERRDSTDLLAEEAADCAMLLTEFTAMLGRSLYMEMRRKLAINKARQWGKPNAEGYTEHIRQGG